MTKRLTKAEREKRAKAARKGWETRRARIAAEEKARKARTRKLRAKLEASKKKRAKRGEIELKTKVRVKRFKSNPVRVEPKKPKKPKKPKRKPEKPKRKPEKPLPQVTTQRVKGWKPPKDDAVRRMLEFLTGHVERLPKLKTWFLDAPTDKDRFTRFDLWGRSQMALEKGHKAMVELAGLEGYTVREIYSIAYGSP